MKSQFSILLMVKMLDSVDEIPFGLLLHPVAPMVIRAS